MKRKEVLITELRVGDRIGWYDISTPVSRLQDEGDRIRVYVTLTPSNQYRMSDYAFMKNDSITRYGEPRLNHDVCRDSDCDCIYDGVE